MIKRPPKAEQLKRASDGDLLDKGRELLVPTVAIARHIKNLRIDPKHLASGADLDKILLATDRLSELINKCFSKVCTIKSGVDIQVLNSKIHHDLCTPLIAITGYSELVLEDLEGDLQACEKLEHVLLLSQKLLSLIKELNYPVEIAAVTSSEVVMLNQNPCHQTEPEYKSTSNHAVMSGINETVEKQEAASLLVVDDRESNRDFLSRRLRKQGFSVDVAENGRLKLSVRSYPKILAEPRAMSV